MIEHACLSFLCVLQTQFTVPLHTALVKTEPHSPQRILFEKILSSLNAVVILLLLSFMSSATASKITLSIMAGTRSGMKYWSRSPWFNFFLNGSVSVVYFFCTRTSPAYFSLQRIYVIADAFQHSLPSRVGIPIAVICAAISSRLNPDR